MNSKVSILVPVYGVEKYIERCARSLFEQTYPDIEYIFVDDCSPDKSIDILTRVMVDYPARENSIKIIYHKQNKGSGGTRNTCVANASGDFVLWVDADDCIDETLVYKLLKKQEENNADIVCYDIKVDFGNFVEYYTNKDYEGGKDLTIKMLLGEAPHQLCGHLIRRSLYVEKKIVIQEGINQAEDLNAMVRLAYYSKNVGTLHEPLYYYDRTRETSASNNFTIERELQIRETYKILYVFFRNKGEEFNKAMTINEVKSLVERMKFLSQIEDDEGLYNSLINRLLTIKRQYWKGIKLYNRPILYIRNKTFVMYYSYLLKKMKMLLMKLEVHSSLRV